MEIMVNDLIYTHFMAIIPSDVHDVYVRRMDIWDCVRVYADLIAINATDLW